MENLRYGILGPVAMLLALLLVSLPAPAQDQRVQSLRGTTPLEETGGKPDSSEQNTGRPFARAYRQQPPLIPHKIDNYEIDIKVNQCLRCHDWPYSVEEGATKVSETHYIDRNGVALDQVSRTRWFCTQCHVPQTRAGTLIGNDFRSTFDLD